MTGIDPSRLRKRRSTAPRRRKAAKDWRKPLGILGVASLSLLALSLILMSRSDNDALLLHSSTLTQKDRDDWDESSQKSKSNNGVLHVVFTRFMQDQPKLIHLARARLLLFEKICLPTMIQQSTQQFIWIIQTDPKLDNDIRHSLKQLLKPYPNYFLIGSNTQIQGETFRSIGKELLKSPLYTGNVKLLRQAYLNRNNIPLLQTRLDADDGLQFNYLERLQEESTHIFFNNQGGGGDTTDTDTGADTLDWYYWCIKRHFEWYSDSNALNPVEHSRLCITPGLTVGMGVAPLVKPPPLHLAHDVLFKEISASSSPAAYSCGGGRRQRQQTSCIRMLDEIAVGAVRSRTWTSAGMMDIFAATSNDSVPQDRLWEILQQQFGISDLTKIGSYLKEHLLEIAKDNLEGQCTNGHSCKLKSVEALQRLIDLQREGGNLKTVDVLH